MKLWSDSWTNGEPIPARYAAGKLDAAGGVGFSDNLNPHLQWSELPAGTRSLVLIRIPELRNCLTAPGP